MNQEERKFNFRKEEFLITYHYYKCEDTDEVFTTDKLDELNTNQVYNQYREKYGVPFPDEIKEMRERYGLSARKMSEVLGLGINGYRQYEQGEMPTVANGRLLLAAQDPKEFLTFLDASKNVLEARNYEKIRKRIVNLIEQEEDNQWEKLVEGKIFYCSHPCAHSGYRKPNSDKAGQVINYFSDKIDLLYKTKLNKLLFYADFLHYQWTGYSITGNTYRAIKMGPVPTEFEKLYEKLADENVISREFKAFNNGHYGEYFRGLTGYDENAFRKSELAVLEKIIETFGEQTSQALIERSHQEKAWQDCHKDKEVISYLKYAFELKVIDH